MPVPQSEPTIPSQPKQSSFSFSELALFQTYTRESYRAAFSVEAPAFDPSRQIKTWFDSTADTTDPGNIAVYKIVATDAKGLWGIRQMVMPAREAASVNLPGAVTYPPYVVTPTKAARGGVTGIWPETLSLLSEAHALLRELGLPNLELRDDGSGGSLPVFYGDEPRRQWAFNYRGASYGVG